MSFALWVTQNSADEAILKENIGESHPARSLASTAPLLSAASLA
jgi:hypothetical protein